MTPACLRRGLQRGGGAVELGGSATAGTERGGERFVAGEIAEHPEDIGGLGAVVDGRDGSGKGWPALSPGLAGLDQGEGGAAGFQSISRA